MKHLNVGEIVKEEGLHEGWDEEWGCWIVDEDRVSDWNDERGLASGGGRMPFRRRQSDLYTDCFTSLTSWPDLNEGYISSSRAMSNPGTGSHNDGFIVNLTPPDPYLLITKLRLPH